MRLKRIFALLLAVVFSMLTPVTAWAVGFISTQQAYDNAAAGNGIIIDIRSVEEHNGCNQNWRNPGGAGSLCGTDTNGQEAENRGSPQWIDTATGVMRQAPNVPFWISSAASDTQPESSLIYSSSFDALREAGVIDFNTPIYLLGRSGYRSYYGGIYLEGLGYNNVYTVDSDGTFDNGAGGMLEWSTTPGLPVHYGEVVGDRGGHGPQIYSGEPLDGFIETETNTVTFTAGILEPPWGRTGWNYPAVVRVSLYIDGVEVDFSTTDTYGPGTVYTFIQDLPDGAHTWNMRAETEDGFSGVHISWNLHSNGALPGDRILIIGSIGSLLPDITVTDSAAPVDDLLIPFGIITSGILSNQTVTIANNGAADLEIGSIGTLSAPFSILNDNCSGQTLIPLADCTLTVRFSPAAAGTFNDSFDIPSNDTDENPVIISVNGTAVTDPMPDITVTDSIAPVDDLLIPFGVITESISSDQTVTIANDGIADLEIGSIGILSAPFSILNDDCSGETLISLADCTLTVRFSPAAAGTFNDSFDIPSNDPDEDPVTVSVSGTGSSSEWNNPPSIPELVYPTDGQTGVPTTVELRWKTSTDLDGDEVNYEIYFCKNEDFSGCEPVEGLVSALSSQPSAFSYYAGILIFGIVLASGVNRRRFTRKGTLRRSMSLLTGMILLTGMFLVSCGNDLSDKFKSPGAGSGDEISFTPVLEPDTGTTYYWQVVAKDGNGGETPSEVWSFTTISFFR